MREEYQNEIISLKINIVILSIFTGFLTYVVIGTGVFIIQTFLSMESLMAEDRITAIVSLGTAIISFFPLIGFCFAVRGFYKMLMRHRNVMNRLKQGDIDKDVVTVLSKRRGRSGKHGTYSYLDILHSDNRKTTYSATAKIYDSVLEGEQVTIEYFKEYDRIMFIRKY